MIMLKMWEPFLLVSEKRLKVGSHLLPGSLVLAWPKVSQRGQAAEKPNLPVGSSESLVRG